MNMKHVRRTYEFTFDVFCINEYISTNDDKSTKISMNERHSIIVSITILKLHEIYINENVEKNLDDSTNVTNDEKSNNSLNATIE